MDASIKNQVAMSIVHIYCWNYPIMKTIYHAINVISMEAELFTIRCGINQVTQLQGINKIIIVTNFIHFANKILDYSSYSHQAYSATISCKLQEFFSINNTNTIKFWESPSHCKWFLHSAVNSETRKYQQNPSFPWITLWNFSKKRECNDIINEWEMIFQTSDGKGRNFLDLVDDENNPLELSYSKDNTWLQYFGHSNLLCTRIKSYYQSCAHRRISSQVLS